MTTERPISRLRIEKLIRQWDSDPTLPREPLPASVAKLNVPIIPRIDAVILAAINAGGILYMGDWHGRKGTCGTTHCRGGWAIHCAGERGRELEKQLGTWLAASLIYLVSRPGMRLPQFFTSSPAALMDIQQCAAQQLAKEPA